MKKFFGLKMTLAALAVVSFASCYDSEGSDVIIPTSTTITWPDPVYVVNGVVTDYDAGNVMSGVAVSGAITDTTDENGAFSVTLTSPVSGDVDFAKEGYLRATRTLKVASLVKGQGNAIYNMNVAMIAVTSPSMAANIKETEVEAPVEVAAEAEVISVADLEAWGYDPSNFVNDTDEEKSFDIWAGAIAHDLPYGMIAAASKADDGKTIFIEYVQREFGNDPFEGYRIYNGSLHVTIPAHFQTTSFLVTPLMVAKTLVFPLAEGDYTVAVESITDYRVKADGKSLDHDHGHTHTHSNNPNAGGGEVGGE